MRLKVSGASLSSLVLSSLLLLLGAVAAGAREESPAAERQAPRPPVRPVVRSVTIRGNHAFEESRLEAILTLRPGSWWLLQKRTRYVPELLDGDLKALKLFYQQHGYLQMQVTASQVLPVPSKNVVVIEVEIEEGPLTTVGSISLHGNQVLSTGAIRNRIRSRDGEAFEAPVVREDTLAIMKMYADLGYLEADVRPAITIQAETREAAIDFAIEEKSQFRIGRIRVKGAEKTRDHVIRRELAFQPGEIVSYSGLMESQRLLFRTGLFQDVFVSPVASESGEADRKDILVEVNEADSLSMDASVSYATVGKLGASLELRNSNIGGYALNAALTGAIDFLGLSAQASFSAPWTFGLRLQSDLSARLEALKQPGYDVTRAVGALGLGVRLNDRSHATLSYRYEWARIGEVRVTPAPADVDTNVHSLVVSYVLDTRDDLLSPTRGLFLQWSNELGLDLTRLANPFYRTTGTLRAFLPATTSTVLASGLSFGWIAHLVTPAEFPLSQRFYAGGPGSLRSFGYQQVGPQDAQGVPLGGTLMVVLNVLEVRQTLFRGLGVVLFADAGGVWDAQRALSLDDLGFGVGLGLRLNTPIGVLRLDGALKIRPRPDDPPGAIYFGIGQAF